MEFRRARYSESSNFFRKKMGPKKRLMRRAGCGINLTARKKQKGEENEGDNIKIFDFSTPKNLFQSFLSPLSLDTFFESYWEKQPIHVSRAQNPEYASHYAKLFSVDALRGLMPKQLLHYRYDFTAVRYVDQERQDVSAVVLRADKFDQLFNKEKATIQFHQPQRFQDELWRLLENLESYFGCLVGSNVYITPPGAQGLPPHHDDVEVFILQLEGDKHWQLHKPLSELPRAYSRDLKESEIGEPTHNIIMKPGDLLYFPRGTVHYAKTLDGGSHSTHITISTYQRNTWGDYMMCVFPKILEESIKKEKVLREGLPINFLASEKLSQSEGFNSVLNTLLQKLKCEKYTEPAEMMEDFTRNRLPPYGVNAETLKKTSIHGFLPCLDSEVKLQFAEWVRCVTRRDEEAAAVESDSESDASDEFTLYVNGVSSRIPKFKPENTGIEVQPKDVEMLFVYNSYLNNRRKHMMPPLYGEEGSDAPKFPKHFLPGINFLISKSAEYVRVCDIPLQSDDDKETLARGLWGTYLLQVKPIEFKKAKKAKMRSRRR